MKALCAALVLCCGVAWADPVSCAEALDAGVPAPALKLPAGTVLPADSWVITPARMCAVGQALASCEAQNASLRPSVTPAPWVVVTIVGVLAAGAGFGLGFAVAKAPAPKP